MNEGGHGTDLRGDLQQTRWRCITDLDDKEILLSLTTSFP